MDGHQNILHFNILVINVPWVHREAEHTSLYYNTILNKEADKQDLREVVRIID